MAASIPSGVQWTRWRRVGYSGSEPEEQEARKFFRKLLKGLRYVPRMIITDKLKSYSAAKTEVMPSVEHLHQKYHNNREENSHQPTRLREKVMRRFRQRATRSVFSQPSGSSPRTSEWGDISTELFSYREAMKSRF